MLVIAGAGSGKTRTIVYCVAKLLSQGVKPSEIMLVTFTNKAAKEMISRVEILLGKKPKGIWAGTFHALGNRFLRMYAKTLNLKPNYTIMDESDAKALMKICVNKANVMELNQRFPTPVMVKSIISYSINRNKSLNDVVLWKYQQFDDKEVLSKIKQVYRIYREKKYEEGLLDFDDLLLLWNQLLDEKAVAQLIARKIKYILVDEYQDTNYLQDEIISKLTNQNPKRNIIAVGDDAQSIYAFRGADFQNIINFSEKYKDCRVFKITYNYRSRPEILDLANDSIRHNKKQYSKDMKPTRNSGQKPYLLSVIDEDEQARFISSQVLNLQQQGFELKEMAVLVRAASHLLKIELELRAKNIPYEVRAGVSFFERAHIKDLIMHLKAIENPLDEIAWSRIFTIIPGVGNKSAARIYDALVKTTNPLKSLTNYDFYAKYLKVARISKKAITNIIRHLVPLKDLTNENPPSDVIYELSKILEDHLKSKYDNWQERMEDLNQLGIYASAYSTIRTFLETLSLNRSNIESRTTKEVESSMDEEPLVLSTIHRAKGLEWRVVFIPMLCNEFFPSSRVGEDDDAFEEERRIFYVAVTRAKDQLYLLSPSVTQRYGGFQTTYTSLFLEELDPEVYIDSSVKFVPNEKGKTNSLFHSADELL